MESDDRILQDSAITPHDIIVLKTVKASECTFATMPTGKWERRHYTDAEIANASPFLLEGMKHCFYRDSGMYVEIGFERNSLEASFALYQLETKDKPPEPEIRKPMSKEESRRWLREFLIELGAEESAIDEMFERCKNGTYPAILSEPNSSNVFLAVVELFDWFMSLCSFEKELSLIEKELDEIAAQNFTPDEKVGWNSSGFADFASARVTGWKHHAFNAKSLCKGLRKELTDRRFNLAVRKSFKLGEEMATLRFRRDFEKFVAKSRRSSLPLKRRQEQTPKESKRRQQMVIEELFRLHEENPHPTKTSHLKAMAKTKRFGGLRTLMKYCRDISLPKDNS